MYERKKDLINNSKLTDSQKLKLMNEIDNFSEEWKKKIKDFYKFEEGKEKSNETNSPKEDNGEEIKINFE